MQLPRQDGLASTTFTPLPLDDPEALLLPDVLHYHAKFNSDHPVFVYQDGISGPKITLTWGDTFRAFERMGCVMLRKIDGASPRTVVGVLAASDQITYLTTLGGLLLAGLVPFLISPRNSDAAIAHLLRSTECRHLLVNEADASTCKLADAVQARMAEGRDGLSVSLLSLPSYEEIFRDDDSAVVAPLPKLKVADDDVAVIMHSSGSSAFPKVVPISHRFLRETGLTPYSGEVDLAGQVLSIHAIPMFHMLGLNEFLYGVYTGMALAGFSPRSPVPKVPTGDIVLAAAQATDATMLVCTPSFLETLDLDQPTTTLLSSLSAVIFGGGPLRQSVGDSLAAHGAHLVHQYGSTEASGVSLVVPARNPEEGWDWFKARTSSRLTRTQYSSPRASLAYFTSLSRPARRTHLQSSTLAADLIPTIFSSSTRPTRHSGRCTDDKMTKSCIRMAKRLTPFPLMILVADPAKPIELTAKGNPRRQWVLDAYSDEIYALYDDVEGTLPKHTEMPTTFDSASSLTFVRKVVGEVMTELPPDDDADLFQHGCDSLQATWIRNSILHAASTSEQLKNKPLPSNFVYAYPSIAKLGHLLTSLSATPTIRPNFNGAEDDPVVEICEGSDIPLIILPGATGSITRFYGLRQHYRGRVWGVRITDSTPLDSLETMVAFWASKIREKQPVGPYRIATFCVASLHGVLLTKMLEEAGQEVKQLAFLDHFPMLYLREGAATVLRAVTQAEYVKLSAGDVIELLQRDSTIPETAVLNYVAAANGNLDAPAINIRDARISGIFVGHIYNFIRSFFSSSPEPRTSLAHWLSSFDAPAALFVAENGISHVNPGAWSDFGAHLVAPKHVEVHFLDGVGHFAMFSDERVARLLEAQ
ncbi:Acetyl-CoA synthetase-like protein [Mycena chlorophos]|uniref:Acetyl-CoA synthetase-like protein n=1 Tax=Mycena chlorophos TaxID=658473 RepID=A0A8H6W4H4_MYCCL|nr:Acetyl-CoA synthetase-like protein [Mycena chlorophos]